MESVSGVEKLNTALTMQYDMRSKVAAYAVANGVAMLQKLNYTAAVEQFKKAIALDPTSQDAYEKLGNTYLQQNRTKDAILAFKNLVRLNPTSADAYNSLGNAYLQDKNYADAEKQYKISASLDKGSTYAPYTLGNLYVQTDRLSEAETQFKKVISLAPKDAHGYYGIGLVANKMGKFDEAVRELSKATGMKEDFDSAIYELGNAYFGLGDKEKAQEQLDALKGMGSYLASDLSMTLFSPKIIATLPSAKTFSHLKGPGSLLSSLDPLLSTANSSKDFTMVFQFNADMDVESVNNPFNWSISKAGGGGAGLYNNGVNLNPEKEALIPAIPKSVNYDPGSMRATLTFTLMQNSQADATIDPSHIVFKFSGKDVNGNLMDQSADEVDGFAGLPF